MIKNMGSGAESSPHNESDYGKNLKILTCNDQLKELQTIIRDKYELRLN